MKKIFKPPFRGFFTLTILPVILVRGISLVTTMPKGGKFIAEVTAITIVLAIVVKTMWKKVKQGIWTPKQLGFTLKDVDTPSVAFYFLLTFVYSIGFIKIYSKDYTNHLTVISYIAAGIFVFIQELICRSYLMKVGKDIFKKTWINIIVNIIVFTFMHAIFSDLGFKEYALLAIAGAGFSIAYKLYPSLLMICLFHYATNLLSLHLGMFKPIFY